MCLHATVLGQEWDAAVRPEVLSGVYPWLVL